jgi:uncharacterized protein
LTEQEVTIVRKEYMKNGLALFLVIMASVTLLVPSTIYASAFENDETGYRALIVDEADLLSSSEEADLLEEMEEITEYSNVAFVSVDQNYSSTENLAMRLNEEYFGNDSGIVFIIDMDNRYIWIDSMGGARKTITDDYAQTITDNVYSYASDEDYYKCASRAFAQIHSLFEGQWIAQPMKYISNAFLAVALALLINYFIVRMLSRASKASARQITGGIFTKVDINNARANFTHQTKRYSPQSSGSSGSGRSGGGGGGGGHSGGGHRF